MVKFNVIDFILGPGLEALLNQSILGVGGLQTEVVENGSETAHAHKATSALVLVLKVGLHIETTVAHVSAQSGQRGVQFLLLRVVEHVFGVQNGGRIKLLRLVQRVFLEVLVREDVVQVVAELFVVCHIAAVAIVVVQKGELRVSQPDSLHMKHSLEFLVGHCALAQRVVVLEELEKADSVALDHVLNLSHEFGHVA